MRPSRAVLTAAMTAHADTAVPTVRLTRRVRRIAEGVRENALLAGPLEEHVARIERSLLPVLEAASRPGVRGADE